MPGLAEATTSYHHGPSGTKISWPWPATPVPAGVKTKLGSGPQRRPVTQPGWTAVSAIVSMM
jgi:hypothetical protein